jgi:hypothetical protein
VIKFITWTSITPCRFIWTFIGSNTFNIVIFLFTSNFLFYFIYVLSVESIELLDQYVFFFYDVFLISEQVQLII